MVERTQSQSIRELAKSTWRLFADRLSLRRDDGPIDCVEALEYFVATRAAFVAQKTLYGYLKTRMGTRYPSMFEDDVFVHSINIAKFEVFAACASDLAIYVVANALAPPEADGDAPRVTDERRRSVALRCFAAALSRNIEQAPPEFSSHKRTDEFLARLAATDWEGAARQRGIFAESPRALVRWAPIAPELKRYDAEMVRNSIGFAWTEVRQAFIRKIRPAEVVADALR